MRNKFPNKMINQTYNLAIGHVFRHRPHAQKFVDEHENTDYDYSAMIIMLLKSWALHRKQLLY